MQNENNSEATQLITRQFLCGTPVKEIWLSFDNFNLETQEEIIKNTVLSQQVLKFPINVNYQKNFLKYLLQLLEKQSSTVHDSLYEEYARLVALPENKSNFKHYRLENSEKDIILKEDVNLITDGTTGLRTWQASLALSEWILQNTQFFSNKIVLELGSGIGLTGLVISLHCQAKAVHLSDCHPTVLENLSHNYFINIDSNSHSLVDILNLPWEDISPQCCENLGPINVLIGADIVYDKSIFKNLIFAVNNLFKHCGVTNFILSCTERNKDTLLDFLLLLEANRYEICKVETPSQRNFFWATTEPVKIFNIFKISGNCKCIVMS